MKITKKMPIEILAAVVSTALTEAGLDAVLSGGGVVSIYSNNEYESFDLDFVTPESIKELQRVMAELGFKKSSGRHFFHPNSKYFVEFPAAPLALGNEPVKTWAKLKTKAGVIQILSPTQCVMDRLAGFYAWNDKQNLDQAVMVASHHPVKLSMIKRWSVKEGSIEQYGQFLEMLKAAKKRSKI